jgi:hypothetical protein
MRVELHDGMKGAVNIPATRVVVYDQYDNPIAVVVHIEGGQYVAATVTQGSFHKILKALGINKTVVVERLDPRKLKSLD